jgi:hypothetical protein
MELLEAVIEFFFKLNPATADFKAAVDVANDRRLDPFERVNEARNHALSVGTHRSFSFIADHSTPAVNVLTGAYEFERGAEVTL